MGSISVCGNFRFIILAFMIIFVPIFVSTCGGGGNSTSTSRAGSNAQEDTPVVYAVCGNNTVDKGEMCDDGNTTTEHCTYGIAACAVCDKFCNSIAGATSYCGDTIIDKTNGEQCEDGNDVEADGCSTTCTVGDVATNAWIFFPGYLCELGTGKNIL